MKQSNSTLLCASWSNNLTGWADKDVKHKLFRSTNWKTCPYFPFLCVKHTNILEIFKHFPDRVEIKLIKRSRQDIASGDFHEQTEAQRMAVNAESQFCTLLRPCTANVGSIIIQIKARGKKLSRFRVPSSLSCCRWACIGTTVCQLL